MSDIMLGVLRMPPDLWGDDELDVGQRHAIYCEAAAEIERLQHELATVRSLLYEATKAGTPYAADRDARNGLVLENQRLQLLLATPPTWLCHECLQQWRMREAFSEATRKERP